MSNIFLPACFLGICLIIIVHKQFCFLGVFSLPFNILSKACVIQLVRTDHHNFNTTASIAKLVCIYNTKELNTKFLCHHMPSFTIEVVHASLAVTCARGCTAPYTSTVVRFHECQNWVLPWPVSGFGDEFGPWTSLLDLPSFHFSAFQISVLTDNLWPTLTLVRLTLLEYQHILSPRESSTQHFTL